ncbi:MAG: wax ester/triacylglycerol synthase family O-acyltransferase [Pseudomonadales bacterium]
MRRLDGASAFMIYNDQPASYQHTLKIAILDADAASSELDFNRILLEAQKAVQKFPMLMWKLAKVPMGLNHPVWIQDQDFEIAHHMRRIACPGRKDKDAFCQLVAELYSQPLDQSRPLWQTWIVEGLAGGQVALVTNLHHAYADGAGASMLVQGVMSEDSVTSTKSSLELGVDPDMSPGTFEVLFKGLVDLPRVFIQGVPPVIKSMTNQKRLQREYMACGEALPANGKDAPDSPLNTDYSHGRTFYYKNFMLSEFRQLSNHFNVSINDLLIAVVSGAVRRFYLENNHPITAPLICYIPINIRSNEQKQEVLGNHVDSGFVQVPIHLEDPIDRLQASKESATTMKKYREAVGGSTLPKALEILPPLVAKLVSREIRRSKGQMKMMGNLAISNVKGPRKPMNIYGRRVNRWLSIGQVGAGIGLNITAWSYVDNFSVCLLAERKVINNGPAFMSHLEAAFAEYQDLINA